MENTYHFIIQGSASLEKWGKFKKSLHKFRFVKLHVFIIPCISKFSYPFYVIFLQYSFGRILSSPFLSTITFHILQISYPCILAESYTGCNFSSKTLINASLSFSAMYNSSIDHGITRLSL